MIVVIVMGLPGTGKSTLATMLDQNISNCIYLCTDELRKALFSHFVDSNKSDEIYREYNIELVYNTLVFILEKFRTVVDHFIIDATYHKASRREKLIRTLKKWDIKYHFFNTLVEEEIIKKRMQQRGADSLSDARFAEYLRLKGEWEEITDLIHYSEIDTSKPVEQSYSDLTGSLTKLFPGIL
jgi:predicted kinase